MAGEEAVVTPAGPVLGTVTATSFDEAIKYVVMYVKACLRIGGLPMVRTHYAKHPFKFGDYLGIMLVCYGRADFLPRLWVYAPADDPRWRSFVETLKRMVGDYRYILAEYGHLVPDEEVESYLKKLLPAELIEKLAKLPVIPAATAEKLLAHSYGLTAVAVKA